MKKILLICPHFMDYDKQMINELQKDYFVKYIDNERFLKEVRNKYYKLPIIIKGILKFFPKVREQFRESLLEKYDNKIEYEINNDDNIYDYIIVINGDGYSNRLYKKLFYKQKSAFKILYIWDDFSWLFKNTHVELFEKVFSFNIVDCKEKSFLYMPMFTKKIENNEIKKIYDISIVASANKERIEVAKHLYYKYKGKYKFYIYFYSKEDNYDFFCNDKPLSYDDYQEVLLKSKIMVDCYRGGQKGPTTRVYDSLMTKTKIITTNKLISKYPIYNENILILDKTYNIPKNFVFDEYLETEIKPITLDLWIRHLMFKNTDYYKKEINE